MKQKHSTTGPRMARALSASLLGGLVALAACASPAPLATTVLHAPVSYNTLARSPAVRGNAQNAPAPQPTYGYGTPQPTYGASQANYTAPRPAYGAQPTASQPTYAPQPIVRSAPTPVATSVYRSTPAAVPAPVTVSRPTPVTVPVATRSVSAPSTPVVTRSAMVAAPRVTGTVSDAGLLSQFEAHEAWVADEAVAYASERRILQGLLSAHYRYEGDPSPANREKIVEKADELRDVARIARSIDANSSRSEIERIENEVASQAQVTTERRRDVMRVIIAIQGYRQSADAQAKARLLEALERFSNGTR